MLWSILTILDCHVLMRNVICVENYRREIRTIPNTGIAVSQGEVRSLINRE